MLEFLGEMLNFLWILLRATRLATHFSLRLRHFGVFTPRNDELPLSKIQCFI